MRTAVARRIVEASLVAGLAVAVPFAPVWAAVPLANTAPGSVSVTVASSNIAVGQGQVTASWTAVPGAIGYALTAKAGGVSVATTTVVAPITSGTIVGLTGGVTYDIVVRTADVGGFGSESNPVQAVALTVPESPAFTVTGGTVTWTAPNNGGSPITGYSVTQNSTGTTLTAAADATSVTFTTEDATAANYTVTATNAVGTSSSGAAAISTPSAPRGLSASGTATSITATWQEPASTGGAAITGYAATLSQGATTLATTSTDASTRQATFTGLSAGTFALSVRAVNSQGAGLPAGVSVTIAADGDVTVTPIASPSTPSESTATLVAPTAPNSSVGTSTPSTPSATPSTPSVQKAPTGALPKSVSTSVKATTTVTLRKAVNVNPKKLYVWLSSKKTGSSTPSVRVKSGKKGITLTFLAPKRPGTYSLRVYQVGVRAPVATSTLVVKAR